ncbi:MAG: polysaccharide deacetylase family protein [Lachnospiraceae bacterium]
MMKKRLMAIVLSGALSVSALAGCGQNAQSTSTASSKTASSADSKASESKTESQGTESKTGELDAEGFLVLSTPETVYPVLPINVRKAPGMDAEILGVVSKGTPITRTATKEGWSRVEYNGGIGYMASEYLAKDAEGQSVESQSTQSQGTESQNPEGQGTESQTPESQGTESPTTESPGTESPSQPSEGGLPDYSAYMNWDLASLSNELVPFGYDNNDRDERNIPNGWAYYENLWGEFNVDYIGDTSKNVIYLTMDEGYANTNTEVILDTLAAKGVKAVFFLTWNFVTERPDLVRRMIDEGHMLGNHTVSHKSMSTLSIEEQTKEVMDLENYVQENFGYKMVLFRYPEGAFSKQSMGLINNLGFKVSFWSYAYNDYSEEQMPVPEALQKALDSVHPGAIYLLHAKSDTNTAMLADFIDGVRAKGFEFGVYDLTAR